MTTGYIKDSGIPLAIQSTSHIYYDESINNSLSFSLMFHRTDSKIFPAAKAIISML